MTAPSRIVALVVLLGAAVGGYRWWTSPERQIRRVLDGIADRLTHDQPATGLGAVAAAAAMQDYFSRDVVVDPGRPFGTLSGRDAVLTAAARVRSLTPALRVAFVDVRVALGSDGETATVNGTVSATTADRAGQETVDAREVILAMRRVDGRWVVQRATAVNVLEPVT